MRKLLAIALAPLALAAAEKDSAPGVAATFRALAFESPIADAAYAVSEHERMPLLITSDFLTVEQRYRGPADIVFTHLAKDLSERPLATARLADRSRVILLFVPDGKGGQQVKVLGDAEGQFPWGSLRLVNLTGGRVRLSSGNRTLLMANGDDRVFRPAAGHRQYAMTEIQTERDDGFALGYMLRTFQEDNLRALYFLLPGDPREHAIRLKAVEERRGDESQPPPQPTPISLKPREKPATRPGAPLSGQPRDARR